MVEPSPLSWAKKLMKPGIGPELVGEGGSLLGRAEADLGVDSHGGQSLPGGVRSAPSAVDNGNPILEPLLACLAAALTVITALMVISPAVRELG